MSQAQAARTGMQEYIQRLNGHEKVVREAWEVARWQEWRQTMLSPFLKASDRPRTPKDILLLPGETPARDDITKEMCHIPEETQAALTAIMEDFIARKKQRNG